MRITFNLDAKSINRAIREINNYAKKIDKFAEELVYEMVQNGEYYAINRITSHVDTGETIASVMGYREGNKGLIVADGAAIWLEFGTGVIRNTSDFPHPKAQELGMSAIGTYGKGNGSNPDGWYYYDKKGRKHHTNGIEATMFMYETAKQLRDELEFSAKEVFERL